MTYTERYAAGTAAHVLLVEAEAELAELRADHEATYARLLEVRDDRDRLKSNLLALDTAAVKRYDELREAVRQAIGYCQDGQPEDAVNVLRSRLIEEKE